MVSPRYLIDKDHQLYCILPSWLNSARSDGREGTMRKAVEIHLTAEQEKKLSIWATGRACASADGARQDHLACGGFEQY